MPRRRFGFHIVQGGSPLGLGRFSRGECTPWGAPACLPKFPGPLSCGVYGNTMGQTLSIGQSLNQPDPGSEEGWWGAGLREV